MSSIPAAAMPHAKAHEPAAEPDVAPAPAPAPVPSPAVKKPFPWLAIAIGGALIAGTAIGASALLRKPAPAKRRGRKPGTKATATRSRRAKSDA